MFEQYYLQQLTNLRNKASRFAEEHPAIAPLLMENSTDPDVERLLEGSAFLSAVLHEKIDDDIPELIRGIVDILFPHFLRPLPSSCIIAFNPKDALIDTIKVETGTQLASEPVDGTRCLFKTTMDVVIAPISIRNVKYDKTSTNDEQITVSINVNNTTLDEIRLSELIFFTGGDYTEASQFFMRLCTSLKKITVTAAGTTFTLPRTAFSTPGFDSDTLLLSSSNTPASRYTIITDYFQFPEKFLFYKIDNLDKLAEFPQTASFDITFHFQTKRELLQCKDSFFTLFATPAVNLFPFEADPVQVDHTIDKLPVRPSAKSSNHYDIYTIDSVTGFVQGTVVRKTYMPYNKFRKRDGASSFFQIQQGRSIIDNSRELFISLCYETLPQVLREVLSIDLTCTNGHLPSRLKPGDISQPTSQSPALATYKNLTVPTEQVDVILDNNILWHFLSDFTVNLSPVSNAESLKELLQKYTFYNQRSDSTVLNNLKRINSIEKFCTEFTERIVNGILMRGMKYTITFNETSFSSAGDAYLFFSVLNRFLSWYTSINTFTQLEIYNVKSGERTEWTPVIGAKSLL
jgi:type VI secretion system protein ImpG